MPEEQKYWKTMAFEAFNAGTIFGDPFLREWAMVFHDGKREVLRIKQDGTVVVPEGVPLEDAASGFWEAVADQGAQFVRTRDERERQLLRANNDEVEKRRAAERLAQEHLDGSRVIMSAYSQAMDRLRAAIKMAGLKQDPLVDCVDMVDQMAAMLAETNLEGRVAEWVRTRIGDANMQPRERAMRTLEESFELAQAEGITEEQACRQARHVFARPAGNPAQEAAGVAICLLGWCASRGERLLDLATRELQRIEGKPVEEIRGSLARKADADLVVTVQTSSQTASEPPVAEPPPRSSSPKTTAELPSDGKPEAGERCTIIGYDQRYDGQEGTVLRVLCTGMRIVELDATWAKGQHGFPAEFVFAAKPKTAEEASK